MTNPLSFLVHTDDGVDLVGDLWDAPSPHTAVLLHGGGQTRHSWKHAGERLAVEGVRTIAMDARGHGDSGWSSDGNYGVNRLARDVELVAEQVTGPVVLIGASMGGIASMCAAPALQERGLLEALVLVDIVPDVNTAGRERIVGFMASAQGGFASLEEAAAAISHYLPHRADRGVTPGLRKNLRLRDDGRWHWHWDPALLHRSPEGLSELGSDLAERAVESLTVPTMLLRGLLSDIVTDEGVRRFRDLVPHAEIVELASAAHTAAADDNDAFTDAVVTFLRRA